MSVKSSVHSYVSKSHASSVTSRLSALERSMAIHEKIAEKTLEGELMNLEADALEKRAAIMRTHSRRVIARNKEMEATAFNVIQQIDEDVDEEQEMMQEALIDKAPDTDIKNKLLCEYLNDCHIVNPVEPERIKRKLTPGDNISYE